MGIDHQKLKSDSIQCLVKQGSIWDETTKIVSEDKPIFGDEDLTAKVDQKRDESYLLNYLANHIADVHYHQSSAKDIWNALEEPHKDEKLCKTNLIDKFLKLRFEDNKEVLPQVKLEQLIMKLKDDKITLSDAFISDAIINQLPPSWMSLSTKMHRKKIRIVDRLDKVHSNQR